jgi:hypothetical protein
VQSDVAIPVFDGHPQYWRGGGDALIFVKAVAAVTASAIELSTNPCRIA